jgi:chitin disaccharide deacetylase
MSSRLVLHADDFGMNRAVTDGILHGFRHGLLTSASMLANAPDACRAAKCWNELERDRAAGSLPSMPNRRRLDDSEEKPFDLGVHLNLTQGRPLIADRYPGELLDAEGRFPGVFALFSHLRRHGEKFAAAVREELARQIEWILDHGLWPTHLNGHQYIEMMRAVTPIVLELAERFDIRTIRAAWEPGLLRTTVLNRLGIMKWPMAMVKRWFAARFRAELDRAGIAHPDAFFGTAHAGGVTLRLLRLFLTCGKPYELVEIAVHPGNCAPLLRRSSADRKSPPGACQQAAAHSDEKCECAVEWRDPLAAARPKELRMLISDSLPAILESQGRRLGRLAGVD